MANSPLTMLFQDPGCEFWNGESGLWIDKEGQVHGVIKCGWWEYIGVISNSPSKIGGVLEDRCSKCRFFEPRKGGHR